jgi:HEAT repeat protein
MEPLEMRRNRRGRALLLLLAATLALGPLACRKKKVESGGKTTAEWVVELENEKDEKVSTARRHLIKIGYRGVMELDAALEHANPDVRRSAALILGEIGPPSAVAVPRLEKCLADDDARVRASAAKTLGLIGPEARVTLPRLIKAASDPDMKVRINAITAMVLLGPDSQDALPVAMAALKAPEPEVRDAGAQALAGMGHDALPAKEELLGSLVRGDSFRWPALLALKGIETKWRAVFPPVMEALKSDRANLRAEAVKVLGLIGWDALEASPELREELKSEDAAYRAEVAWALGRIYRLPVLGEVEEEPSIEEKRAVGKEKLALAAERLERMKGKLKLRSAEAAKLHETEEGKAAVAVLTGALQDGDTVVSQRAAEALIAMGRSLDDAVKALIAAMEGPVEDLSEAKNRNTVVWCAEQLGFAGEAAAPAVETLVEVLESEDLEDEPDVLVMVLESMQNFGKAAHGAIPALCDLVELSDYEVVMMAAIRLLGSFEGLEPGVQKTVVDAVLSALQDDLYQNVRHAAAVALGGMGSAANRADVIEALEKRIKSDKYDKVKKAAEKALAAIKQ